MNAPLRLLVRFVGRRARIALLLSVVGPAHAAGGVVVIANPNVAAVDPSTLQKIYTGRVVELNGVSVTAVNASSAAARGRFLDSYLHEDDEAYVAYWIKRKYAGLGAAPRELPSASAIIAYVRRTPGAIGYVDESDLEPGVVVLLR